MQFLRRTLALGLLLSGEALAMGAVHRLGGRAPFDLPLDRLEPWLRAAPADALAAGARVVALVCAGWLFAGTVAYAAASAARLPGAIRASGWVTPPAIRRVVDGALAASIVAGGFGPGIGAAALGAHDRPSPVVAGVRSGRAPASHPAGPAVPATSAPTFRDAPAPPDSVSAAAAPVEARREMLRGAVVVEPGDNLWDLSAAALARATARDRAALDDREIGRYWHVICDANRDTLRSGDVNLVYPGEIVVLPPVS